MKTTSVICPIIVLATLNVAAAESLNRRFGPDREKGHRSEREFEGARDGFKNRDRANFLGSEYEENAVINADSIDCRVDSTSVLTPGAYADPISFALTGRGRFGTMLLAAASFGSAPLCRPLQGSTGPMKGV